MAYTPLKISIPKPCNEDWNGMHPVSGITERHCDSCAKNVVDFTGFSDAQMHDYVRLNGNKVCGRFRPDQLNRPLRTVHKQKNNPLKVAATAAGMILATSGCDTIDKTQQLVKEDVEVIVLFEGLEFDPPRTGEISLEELERPKACSPVPPELGELVAGKISAQKVPLPPPPEVWDDELVGDIDIEWEEDPIFEEEELIPLPAVEVDQKAVSSPEASSSDGDTLVTLSSGERFPELVGNGEIPEYVNQLHEEFEFIAPEELEARASQNLHDGMLMGLVSYHRPEPTGLDWVKDSLLKTILPPSSTPQTTASHLRPRRNELPPHLNNLTVYPNPFVSELVVAIDLPHAQTVVIDLLDPNGRRVHVESFEGIEGTNNFVIEPKRRKLVHAAYHLRVTDLLGRVVVRTVVR